MEPGRASRGSGWFVVGTRFVGTRFVVGDFFWLGVVDVCRLDCRCGVVWVGCPMCFHLCSRMGSACVWWVRVRLGGCG